MKEKYYKVVFPIFNWITNKKKKKTANNIEQKIIIKC